MRREGGGTWLYGPNMSCDISILLVLGGLVWCDDDYSMVVCVCECGCVPTAHTIWAISFVKLCV